MEIFKLHDFGDVTGIEMGYSPIGRPYMNVLFYYTDGIIIDTGHSNMRHRCLEFLRDKKAEALLLTHFHEDHSGNALHIKLMKNIPVYANPLALDIHLKGFSIQFYQHYMWGKAEKVKAEPLPPVIESGGISLIPVHTPGHTPDHTVYHEKSRGWLFSGDLFVGRQIKFFREGENIYQCIESLEKVKRLDFDSLFCGRNPHVKGGKKQIALKLNFLQDFCGEIHALLESGLDEKGIMKKLYPRENRFLKLITMGNVSFANMVRSVMYHKK